MIYLKDREKEVYDFIRSGKWTALGETCQKELLKQAVHFHASGKLRYNTKTGKTYDTSGKIAEYCNPEDIEAYEDHTEAACWQFSGIITNSVSRVLRGYDF